MNEVERLFDPLIALLRQEFGAHLLGVLATGSRIHGTPGPTSDLDAHVLIDQPRRQRRNIVLDGVEIEMFLNPPFRVRGYFQDQHVGTIHMFAFGQAIYDPHGVIAQLQGEAQAAWQAGPASMGEQDIWMQRYFAADVLRDLADLGEDQASAGLLIPRIVEQMIETHYRLNGRWIEKHKRRLADLDRWAPDVAGLARAALECRPVAERRAALEQLAEHVLAPLGGPMPLEWRTEWETLQTPAKEDAQP
jgi:hypothetical protein